MAHWRLWTARAAAAAAACAAGAWVGSSEPGPAALAQGRAPMIDARRAVDPDRPTFAARPDRAKRAFRAGSAVVDAFWAGAFAEQFPDAEEPYRSPDLQLLYETDAPPFAYGAEGFYQDNYVRVSLMLDTGMEEPIFLIAHEWAHHVQRLDGRHRMLELAQLRAPLSDRDRWTTRYELQAECIAGVFGHYAVRDGLGGVDAKRVASHLTDTSAYADLPTHGRAEQRVTWFRRGYESGQVSICDTFTPDWSSL